MSVVLFSPGLSLAHYRCYIWFVEGRDQSERFLCRDWFFTVEFCTVATVELYAVVTLSPSGDICPLNTPLLDPPTPTPLRENDAATRCRNFVAICQRATTVDVMMSFGR